MQIKESALTLSWLFALCGVLVTLYLSEIIQWPVCHLCWYQRICLYPQAILLGMATFRGDYRLMPYMITLSVIGFLFALYQYLMQLFPVAFEGIPLCGTGADCATMHIQWLGFVTLPLLGVLLFAALAVLQALANKK